MTNLFNNLTIFCDAPRPWGVYFQDSASSQMEALIELHDNIMFYLVIILFGVAWILFSIIRNYVNNKSPINYKYLNHGTLIQLIWIIRPALILILIGFLLICLMNEPTDPLLSTGGGYASTPFGSGGSDRRDFVSKWSSLIQVTKDLIYVNDQLCQLTRDLVHLQNTYGVKAVYAGAGGLSLDIPISLSAENQLLASEDIYRIDTQFTSKSKFAFSLMRRGLETKSALAELGGKNFPVIAGFDTAASNTSDIRARYFSNISAR